MSRLPGHVSVLQVRFLILDGQADWPVVQVLMDGREAFVDRLPGWQGARGTAARAASQAAVSSHR